MKESSNKRTHLLPLRTYFLYIMISLITGLTIITFVSGEKYINLQTETVRNSLHMYSSQLAAGTSEMYETCQNISYYIAYDQLIQAYISETSNDMKYSSYLSAMEQLTNARNLSPYIADIAIIGTSGTSISISSSIDNYLPFYSDLENHRFSFSSVGVINLNETSYQVMAMPMYQFTSGTSKFLGIVFMMLDTEKFFIYNRQYMNNLSDASEVVLLDSDNHLIYESKTLSQALKSYNSSSNGSDLVVDSASYVINSYPTSICECMLYVLVNQNTYIAIANHIRLIQTVIMSIVLLLYLIIIMFMYQPLITSLNKLTNFMKEISNQTTRKYKQGIVIHQGLLGFQEIDDITNAFNEMLTQTNKLNHTIFENHTKMYEFEINQRKTEIAFLRSQVNPHFLYNTLTMICGMASVGMTDEITETASSLSKMFRYSIKGTEMVPLSEEMEIVRSYLKIQQLRFEDRFTVHYSLSEESLSCMIPKMVIQPLVENSIVHGLEPNPQKGELLIEASRDYVNGYLSIWIHDTGIGMSSEKLNSLRYALTHQKRYSNAEETYQNMDADHHDSIGILNVNSRMVLYFGQEYSLILNSEEGVGTDVQLRIPF